MGDRGADGVTIDHIIDYYGVSANESVLPDGWYTYIPQKGVLQYLWNYERTNYSDGTYYETPKRVIQGKDARSIQAVNNAYAYSASDTISPTGGWVSALASLGVKPVGSFLWVRDDITYTDGTSSTTIGWVIRDGAKGNDGISIIKVEEQYYVSNSSTQLTGGSWSGALPEWIDGKTIWSRFKIYFSDGSHSFTTERPYSIAEALQKINIAKAVTDAHWNSCRWCTYQHCYDVIA